MSRVLKDKEVPNNSIIRKDFGRIDYFDSYQIEISNRESVDSIATIIFSAPKWIDLLMKLRDSIVAKFGLKKGSQTELNISNKYSIGSKAVYFTVIDRNDNEIVMAENDRHLNFRTSVLIKREDMLSKIHLITIVKFNNIWGKLYFLPVKPFHQLIIKSSLKRIPT